MKTTTFSSKLMRVFSGALVALTLSSTGCQMYLGGQTLPSPYYIVDDVQYHAPGPEMKLSREAAALKEYAAQRELQQP